MDKFHLHSILIDGDPKSRTAENGTRGMLGCEHLPPYWGELVVFSEAIARGAGTSVSVDIKKNLRRYDSKTGIWIGGIFVPMAGWLLVQQADRWAMLPERCNNGSRTCLVLKPSAAAVIVAAAAAVVSRHCSFNRMIGCCSFSYCDFLPLVVFYIFGLLPWMCCTLTIVYFIRYFFVGTCLVQYSAHTARSGDSQPLEQHQRPLRLRPQTGTALYCTVLYSNYCRYLFSPASHSVQQGRYPLKVYRSSASSGHRPPNRPITAPAGSPSGSSLTQPPGAPPLKVSPVFSCSLSSPLSVALPFS